jgi:hypothetical protein
LSRRSKRSQFGCSWSSGRNVSGLRNSDPYPRGDDACASRAFSMLILNFVSMQKFLAAASFVSSNLNRGGDGHGQSVFWMALMMGTMFLGQKCFGSGNGVT